MKRVVLMGLIIIVFLASGCGDGGSGSGSNGGGNWWSVSEGQWRTSDMGFWVRVPDSIYANGLFLPDRIINNQVEIDQTLTSAADARIQEWCARRGYDCNKVNASFILYDGFDFSCSRSLSETGLCAGIWDEVDTIYSSIYTMWRGYGSPDFISPPQTWMTVEERETIIGWQSPYDYTFYAGIGDPLCPVISHELDEKYFGHDFAHSGK